MWAGIHKLLALHGSPRGIAGGFALGLGLSLIPIPALGMVLALALAPTLRFNITAAYLGTAVVNPVTGSAFYFAELWLGARLLGAPLPSWPELRELDGRAWWTLASELALPFVVGALVLASTVVVVVYPTLWLLVRWLRSTREAISEPSATGSNDSDRES